MYKRFCESLGVSAENIKVPNDNFSRYDIGHNGYFIELKCRESYTYECFFDFWLEETKVNALQQLYIQWKQKGCKGSKAVILYPMSNKVVVIDINKILWNKVSEQKYDSNDVYILKAKEYMNECTAQSTKKKMQKMVYEFPLPHFRKINCVNVYDVDGLKDIYLKYNELYNS